MERLFTLVLLMLLLATDLAAEMKFIREEPISGSWDGLLLRDDATGYKICGVRKLVVDSAGNSTRLFLTTHGEAISKKGVKAPYDFGIGVFRNARIKVDDNAQHRVTNHLFGNRERLINEFKKGESARVVWRDYLKVETSIVSLTGFTKAYDTAKEWCDGDGIPPVITLVGEPSIDIEIGTDYVDKGANASDDNDGDITSKVQPSGSVNTNAVGSYSLTFKVSDAAGNAATPVVRTVNVTPDMTAPVITLLGPTPVSIEMGSEYIDAGVTASDNIDGYISNRIVSTSNVDTSSVGSYRVTYNAKDSAGNAALPVTRTVNVTEDMTPPVISLNGYPVVGFERGTEYVDEGATGIDNVDGDISSHIESMSDVNTDVVGNYSVIYKVSDAAGNEAIPVSRTVNVSPDKTPPVITLMGYPSVSIELGTRYTDAGAMGTDNLDGDISNRIESSSSVNTNVVGSYSITYNASDMAGNAAAPVIRVVNVIADMTPPVITLTGYPSVSVGLGATYVDAGASGTDNLDGDISSRIVSASNVNTNAVGSYKVTYNVKDAAGNAATSVVRTVDVIRTNTANLTDQEDIDKTLDSTGSPLNSVDTQVTRIESISGDWSAIKMKNISTGIEVCGIKTQLESSAGKSTEILLTTHGDGISSEGHKIRYDFSAGSSMDSRIEVDRKKSFQVDKHLLRDREELVEQFKQGRKAEVFWQNGSEEDTATISLMGFTRSYSTAKEWCE